MKPIVLILMLAALLSAGCGRRGGAASTQPTTQTIAPAEGQPAPNGSDTMTQTVEVDDSRSESDGMTGTASTPNPSGTKAPAKAPAKKKGKK